MATAAEIAAVRRMTDEPSTANYTDDAISAILAETGTLYSAAARMWREIAARYSKLVDTSESGSSRRLSQLQTNALSQADWYEKAAAREVITVQEVSGPFTVGVDRA